MTGVDILAAIEKRHAALPRVKVDVPEWGCTLWFPSDLTVAQKHAMNVGIKPEDVDSKLTSFVLHQAQTEDGHQAFEVNAVSRATMEGKAGMKVLLRIINEVGVAETVDEAKNA